MKSNIFLIGMMGAGKSTIGNLLSQKLDIPFFDTDTEIEKIMEMSIDKIFNDFGENRFRMIESVFFNECIKANYNVYATGGGIVENPENHKALKNNGICIFLDCSIEVLNERLKKKYKDRPLIKDNYKNKIKNIYNKRYNQYESCSHININVDNYSESEIVDLIIKELNDKYNQ